MQNEAMIRVLVLIVAWFNTRLCQHLRESNLGTRLCQHLRESNLGVECMFYGSVVSSLDTRGEK